MNKLSHDKIANHFYNLGVQVALVNSGSDKTASYAAISRLAPMGGANIAAGASHVLGGAGLGLGAGLAAGSAELAGLLGGAGAITGKLLKDQNTLRIAESLGALERRAVAKALGGGVSGRVGGALISGGGPIGSLSEILTNQGVRKRVGL